MSDKLLVRAGYIRQFDAGLSSLLFLGQRAMRKIVTTVREELDRIGQEVRLPYCRCPGAVNEETAEQGRTTNDRPGHADTDERMLADMIRGDLRSYKQLPQVWYQVNPRIADELRANSGLLRGREFMVSDSYSLDLDAAAAEASYRSHLDVFRRILGRCGLPTVLVTAGCHTVGATQAQDFMVVAEGGDEVVVSCADCGYAANLEVADSRPHPVEDTDKSSAAPVAVETPTQKTIDEVAAFLRVNASQVIKSYLAVATSAQDDPAPKLPVVAFLRGDHSVNEVKLRGALIEAGFEAAEMPPMEAAEIRECFALEPGFIGPVGLWADSCPVSNKIKWRKPVLLFDLALKGRHNLVAGANKPGFHLRNVTPDDPRSFQVSESSWVDIRNAVEGEGCPNCGAPLSFRSAIKVARLAVLRATSSDPLALRVTDERGREVAPAMGVYRIWLDRLLAASIEVAHDENGFWLAPSIAPFQVLVTPTNTTDQRINSAAEQMATALDAAGIETLLDDRDERPGVKFKDGDLIGVPYRINVGKKIVDGEVELFTRSSSTKENVSLEEVVGLVLQRLSERMREH